MQLELILAAENTTEPLGERTCKVLDVRTGHEVEVKLGSKCVQRIGKSEHSLNRGKLAARRRLWSGLQSMACLQQRC